MDYTVTALLASVRRRGGFPSAAGLGTADADIIRLANEELRLRLLADVLRCREEYYVAVRNFSIVAGHSQYRISRNTVGSTLRKLEVLDGNHYRKLTLLSPDDVDEFTPETQGAPLGYFFRSNTIELVPTPVSSGTLRQHIFLRPGELLAADTTFRFVTTVVADSPSVGQTRVTVSASHSFTTSSSLDFTSPFTGEILSFGVIPVAVGSTTMDFTSTDLHQSISTGNDGGDYIGLRDTAFIPYLPLEWHPILYGRVVSTILRGMGRLKELAENESQLKLEMDAAISLVTPRAQGNAKIITNQSGILSPDG